jgi:hypothetical protein
MLTMLLLVCIRRRLSLRMLLGGNYGRPFEDSETFESFETPEDGTVHDGNGPRFAA